MGLFDWTCRPPSPLLHAIPVDLFYLSQPFEQTLDTPCTHLAHTLGRLQTLFLTGPIAHPRRLIHVLATTACQQDPEKKNGRNSRNSGKIYM